MRNRTEKRGEEGRIQKGRRRFEPGAGTKAVRCAAAVFALFTLVSSASAAYTISFDEQWTPTGSPYEFTEHVVVEEGATLTITPGTVVRFGRSNPDRRGETPGCRLMVRGTLVAAGSPGAPVIFEGLDGETDDWGGILFTDTSGDARFDGKGRYLGGSVIAYAAIRHAGNSAVFAEHASPYLHEVLFEGNEALYDKGEEIVVDPSQLPDERIMGGAVYFYRPDSPVGVVRCSFSGNASAHVGGALALVESYGLPAYVVGCSFNGNATGAKGGGAVRLLGASPRFIDCIFDVNDAERGGAIHASYDANLTLSGCTFTANRAARMGGALFIAHESHAAVTDCTFEDNEVDAGSDMGGGAISIHSNGSAELEACSFTGNIAPEAGALLLTHKKMLDSFPVRAACCSFSGNIALTEGAPHAIEAIDWNHIEIEECTFANAAGSGIEVLVGVGVFEERTDHAADFSGNYWEFGSSEDLVATVSWEQGLDEPEIITGDNLGEPAACAAGV